jgi:hypothetical protein
LTWQGPFPIVEKFNATNYTVKTAKKIKMCHVNHIKSYVQREETICLISVVAESEEDTPIVPTPSLKQTENISSVSFAPELSKKRLSDVKKVLYKNSEVFSDRPGNTKLATCSIPTGNNEPTRVNQYPLPHSKQKIINDEVSKMLEYGVIEKAKSPYNAPVVLVAKKDGSTRFCVDYRKLNATTEFDAEPMPNAQEIFAKVHDAKFFSKFDLSKGYWQIPVAEEDKKKTAFSTADGQYQWTRMPFGLKNAGAVFNRMMRKLLSPLGRNDTFNFVDDVLIASDTWEDHLEAIGAVLERLKEHGLTAKPSKCFFGYNSMDFLGHELTQGELRPDDDKLSKLREAKRPQTKREVRSFLGLAGYYRHFIPNFSDVALPLTEKTKKGQPETVVWDERAEQSFTQLRGALTEKPVLRLADPTKGYTLRTDASDTGMGAVLLQDHDGLLHPVAYASRKFNQAQRNYSTVEKEGLAVVWACCHFQQNLYGKQFYIESDHRPLSILLRNKPANGRLLRWALILQDFDYVLKYIPGRDNHGADFMSRQ